MEKSKTKKRIIMGGISVILIGIVIIVAIMINNQIMERKIMGMPEELPENKIENPSPSNKNQPILMKHKIQIKL